MNLPAGSMVASIVVSGRSVSMSEVNAIFGVASTSTWKAKPEVVSQVPELDKEEWRFEQTAQNCFSFSDALDSLFNHFRGNIEQIANYCLQHQLKISVHLQLEGKDRDFILGFDRSATLVDLAKLNAEFYIHTEKLQCLQTYN
jgi:Domain of unknown function (DUF4279)